MNKITYYLMCNMPVI